MEQDWVSSYFTNLYVCRYICIYNSALYKQTTGLQNRRKNKLLLRPMSAVVPPRGGKTHGWPLLGRPTALDSGKLSGSLGRLQQCCQRILHATVSQVLFLRKGERQDVSHGPTCGRDCREERREHNTSPVDTARISEADTEGEQEPLPQATRMLLSPTYSQGVSSRGVGRPIPGFSGRRAELQDSGKTVSFSHCDSTRVFLS